MREGKRVMKKIFVAALFLLMQLTAVAQKRYTMSGVVRDGKTGELLTGATILVSEKLNAGVSSNEYGFYSLSLPKGNYIFEVSYAGYTAQKKELSLDSNIRIDWELADKQQLQEVVIASGRKDENLRRPVMGTETLNIKEIAKIPVIFGEKDIIKTLQLLPGIKSNGEGSTGFTVRGGSADQNLILLDEAPVYNASHLLGFFSTFNSDAIKDVTIIKGNSPAQYGGRLSSVLDVKMKEGNNRDMNVTGGIGLISSRLSIEGPLQKERSSFIVSARRTYADAFLKLAPSYRDIKLYFYDLNAKANYTVNAKNKLYFSIYSGRDVLGFGNTFNTDWGNTTATLRWNSIMSARLFSNTSLIYSNYDYNIRIKNQETDFTINSKIKDWNLKEDLSFYADPRNSLRFGFNIIHHTITPSRFLGTVVNNTPKLSRRALENAAYLSNSFKVTKKLTADYGLRASFYTILGGNTYNIYDKGIKTDSVVLKNGSSGKTYVNAEPRITAVYLLNNKSSIKAGYSRNTQNLHLMSNSTGGSPTDEWLGNSYNTKPEIGDQVSISYSRTLKENKYELTAEAYGKRMEHQIDYKDGADIITSADVESELLYGKGRAWGVEILFKKKTGKLTGWIGYTLSKTERKIDGINNNEWYNAKQDRTHDLSVVAIYDLTKRWTMSATFIYSTGNAVTFPTGKYNLNGVTVYQYANRNANRMPDNQRLDFSATYEKKRPGKRFQKSWNFGLYNAYGRENAYYYTFRDNKNDPSKTEIERTSLFRWVPSVTYNFKF